MKKQISYKSTTPSFYYINCNFDVNFINDNRMKQLHRIQGIISISKLNRYTLYLHKGDMFDIETISQKILNVCQN